MWQILCILVLLIAGCGDGGSSHKNREIQPPVSCCPEPEQALLCGQCTLAKPCITQKPFVNLVCDNTSWFIQYAYPNSPVAYDYIMSPTKGSPECCPVDQCGIYQFWCLPEMPCRTDNAWLSIYYEPACEFGPCSGTGWKLLELLPENNKTVWEIYINP